MIKNNISCVINTYNEEENIEYALKSVYKWVDEIIIVDMHSTDKTIQIAKKYKAKIYYYKNLGFADPARQFAISKATKEWILILDADELIPIKLSKLLIKLSKESKYDVVNIPRKNYLLGDIIFHSGWNAKLDSQERFFKKGSLKTTKFIHNFISINKNSKIYKIPYNKDICIEHFNYINTEHFVEKLNRYTNIEAKQKFDKNEKSSILKGLIFAILEFGNRYIRRRGYKDGWRGFYLSLMMSFYRIITFVKLKELETIGSKKDVIKNYNRIKENLVNKYN